ncbi:glycine-rich protein 5-like [Solanum pennellii]|uniref:Glycine-rich protein 5-like n=1 Tax=Solanum pennellii TaxID=28526 RepID=A0ABM1H7J1_SOLPN|nr:glycine-rich protein 5-like [Solanum pennellii]
MLDNNSSKASAMISYYGVLFLLYVIIFSCLVVSIVAFSCTDHLENDKVSKKKKKTKSKSIGANCGSNFGATNGVIMYASGACGCSGAGGGGGGGGYGGSGGGGGGYGGC